MKTLSRASRFAAFTILCFTLTAAFAKDNPSFTQVGRSINIGPNEKVGDLTCFGCSIHVRGQVAGDVTAFGGNIVLDENAQVAGDVTAFAGDVRLDQSVTVAGDATVFGGRIRRDAQATISGDVTSMGGRGWFIPILLLPFLILGAFVALIIWIVRRLLRSSLPAAA
jgi:hypothetical protein